MQAGGILQKAEGKRGTKVLQQMAAGRTSMLQALGMMRRAGPGA